MQISRIGPSTNGTLTNGNRLPTRARRWVVELLYPARSTGLTVLFRCTVLLTSMAAASPVGPLTESEKSFLASTEASMRKMMAAMQRAPQADVDQDFIGQMIPHHQGAIDMAKAELQYGRNEQLRRIAQEIIVEQQAEITVMQQQQSLPQVNAAHAGGN
jgi:Domain of unknown function (DUF305)